MGVIEINKMIVQTTNKLKSTLKRKIYYSQLNVIGGTLLLGLPLSPKKQPGCSPLPRHTVYDFIFVG